MITAQQFKQSWEREENEHLSWRLVPFPLHCFSNVRLPASAQEFLIEAGLPEQAAPFLDFQVPKVGALPMVSAIWRQPSEFDCYRIIGSNGSGDPVCLDERVDGQVIYLNHDNNFERVLMASSVVTLAECLLMVRDFSTEIGGFLEPVRQRGFEPLIGKLRAVDPIVCGNGSYWQQELGVS